MEKISVIVPSYNHAQYIEACLDSILFQDHDNIELIIVDDCSTDDSRRVITEYLNGVENDTASHAARYNEETGTVERAVYPRYPQQGRTIKAIFNEKNMGSTWTYNRGFREATGKFCAFVVSDDICHPQMFSTLAAPLERDEADFTYADMFVIDDCHRILREFKLPDYDFEKSFADWYLCGVATLYKRSLHERFGYYDEQARADDHECYLRFAMNGARFLHIPKTLYSVRSHHDREVGLHDPGAFNALLSYSAELTLRAREWLEKERSQD
jgi:glycosyltransferase involved in cell wall biosynthesis